MADCIIPEGYKETVLGVIPKEWEVKKLGDIAKIFSGATPFRENELFFHGGIIPWVKTTDLNNGYLTDTEERITELALKSTTLKIFPRGTVLVAMYGGFNQIGRTAILGINATINQALSALVPNNAKVAEYFLLNWLLFKVNKWRRYAASSRKDPNITKNDVFKFPILVPPLAEQRKIIEVLSVWDKAIEKQTQLIEKLELRKKGLMQQLLTGKKRLPECSDPWKEVRLGDIGSPYNGLSGKNKENFESGDARFIPYINIFLNERIDINNLESVEIGIEEHQNKVKYGDIFFTVSSETPNEVGMASVLLEPLDNTYLNSFCFGYRLNDFLTLSPFFTTYLLRAEYFRHCMYILAQGSTRFNISKRDVMNLKINIPSIEEQTAIAEVLTAADREIELARQKLEQLRQQKYGLMQQLLTGKKRVK